MGLTAGARRALLIACYEGLNGSSFRAALVSRVTSIASEVASGGFITHTSATGTSVEREAPRGSSPPDLAEFWAACLTLFDECYDAVVAGGDETPSDADVYAAMLESLYFRTVPRTSVKYV